MKTKVPVGSLREPTDQRMRYGQVVLRIKRVIPLVKCDGMSPVEIIRNFVKSDRSITPHAFCDVEASIRLIEQLLWIGRTKGQLRCSNN